MMTGIILAVFIFSFLVIFLFTCIKGYGDIGHKLLLDSRRGNQKERLQRGVYRLSKLILCVTFVLIITPFFINLSDLLFHILLNYTAIALLSFFISWVVLGGVQNIIRKKQGRALRPVFDFAVGIHDIQSWHVLSLILLVTLAAFHRGCSN